MNAAPTPAHSKRFFKARVIARVMDKDEKTVRNKARRENWPVKRQGKRIYYAVPRGLQARCNKAAPALGIMEQPANILALKRAAAVLGYVLELQRNPGMGRERAINLTVSRFQNLFSFKERSLWRWIAEVEARGLASLSDHRKGRSGRRPMSLHKMYSKGGYG